MNPGASVIVGTTTPPDLTGAGAGAVDGLCVCVPGGVPCCDATSAAEIIAAAVSTAIQRFMVRGLADDRRGLPPAPSSWKGNLLTSRTRVRASPQTPRARRSRGPDAPLRWRGSLRCARSRLSSVSRSSSCIGSRPTFTRDIRRQVDRSSGAETTSAAKTERCGSFAPADPYARIGTECGLSIVVMPWLPKPVRRVRSP